jgi:hypothetical protein
MEVNLTIQNGEDSEWVLGFLKEDIEKELVRVGKTGCNFCDRKDASIGYIQKKCKLSFHYQCSLENKGLFQFFDTFPAWCRVFLCTNLRQKKRKGLVVSVLN